MVLLAKIILYNYCIFT